MQKKILVLDSGTQGYITLRSLKKAGYYVCLLFKDKHNYADDSRYLDFAYETEYKHDSKEYLELVETIVLSREIDAIIPMSDYSSMFLSKNKDKLLNITNYFLPDYDVFEHGYNKNLLMSLCSQKGYPHPYTINNFKGLELLDKHSLFFPLLVKPNHTCGGRGMTLVHNYEDLLSKFPKITEKYGDCHLQKYIKPGGAQVEVQIYINENKELIASSVIYKYRWYPENGGSSCCATCVINDDVVDMCYRLLKDLGWVGFADFDLIEDPDEGNYKIMELNPRIPACVKAAVVSGVDWPNIIIREYLKQPQEPINFKPGKILKHIGMESLWFYYSSNRFKTKPSLFKVFGKNIYYQDFDWSDPMPFIKGTWHNFKRQLDSSFRRSKSGTR